MLAMEIHHVLAKDAENRTENFFSFVVHAPRIIRRLAVPLQETGRLFGKPKNVAQIVNLHLKRGLVHHIRISLVPYKRSSPLTRTLGFFP